ncbi:MAG: hypothetical protein IKP68_10315 [Clostridia bacterium]|nr:hypothetical protein [Clostridia bacterium]
MEDKEKAPCGACDFERTIETSMKGNLKVISNFILLIKFIIAIKVFFMVTTPFLVLFVPIVLFPCGPLWSGESKGDATS